MSDEERNVIQEIKGYILKYGGSYSSWYVGIAQNPRTRLFNDHAVVEKSDLWIYRRLSTSERARNVEQYFIGALGTDGDTGGGGDSTNSVYGYNKNYHTNP